MRTNLPIHKRAIAVRAWTDLPILLDTYSPDDLKGLGRMCECVCQLVEFLSMPDGKRLQDKNAALHQYVEANYRKNIVLVLRRQGHCFAYTGHDLTRFFRGEFIHGESDIRDDKRRALHEFVFETADSTHWMFFISWNWVAGPNVRSATVHSDTDGPYIHNMTVNGRSFETGTFESILLDVIFNFWLRWTKSAVTQPRKSSIEFDIAAFQDVLGDKICAQLMAQRPYHRYLIGTA